MKILMSNEAQRGVSMPRCLVFFLSFLPDQPQYAEEPMSVSAQYFAYINFRQQRGHLISLDKCVVAAGVPQKKG